MCSVVSYHGPIKPPLRVFDNLLGRCLQKLPQPTSPPDTPKGRSQARALSQEVGLAGRSNGNDTHDTVGVDESPTILGEKSRFSVLSSEGRLPLGLSAHHNAARSTDITHQVGYRKDGWCWGRQGVGQVQSFEQGRVEWYKKRCTAPEVSGEPFSVAGSICSKPRPKELSAHTTSDPRQPAKTGPALPSLAGVLGLASSVVNRDEAGPRMEQWRRFDPDFRETIKPQNVPV
ncbi:hypothetical protein QBC44DRAFT_395291 [Cladorrhinum sp. PSN332]|nr:hypothetical protein QBC44DRAFT_395291 [Cladorrhinum sp. PSN332]